MDVALYPMCCEAGPHSSNAIRLERWDLVKVLGSLEFLTQERIKAFPQASCIGYFPIAVIRPHDHRRMHLILFMASEHYSP